MAELYLMQYSFWAKEYVSRNEDYLALSASCGAMLREESSDSYISNNPSIKEFFVKHPECFDSIEESLERFGFIRGRDEKTASDIIISRLINGNHLLYNIRYLEDSVKLESLRNIFLGINKESLKIEIDLTHNIDLILADIRALLTGMNRFIFQQYNEDYTREMVVSSVLDIVGRQTQESIEAKKIRVKSMSGFNPTSAPVRAVGLWIWDYIQSNRVTQKEAIAALQGTGHISRLGLENVEDSDLRFYFRKTDDCIKSAEVRPFSKKGTQK